MKTRNLNNLSMLTFIFFCIFVPAAAGAAGGVNTGADSVTVAPNDGADLGSIKLVADSATQDCSDHLIDPQSNIITYEDVAPAGYVLEENYGGLGSDHNGWVYHAIDGYYSAIGIEDTAIFRYNSNTGVKQFLGTMRGISEAEGNLNPGEEIAKIHAPIHEYNGKMYFGSHSFHNANEVQRGAHFYSFDLATEVWTDLSKHDPGGVSAPGQGIISMDILRNYNKLVGFTFPRGEIITYDLATNRTTNHGRPISGDPWNVARHIAVTDSGKVYFSYANFDTPLYVFDINTGGFSNTGTTIHYGWLAGSTMNKARTMAYLVDWLGYLYSIDTNTGGIEEIGNIKVSEHMGSSIDWFHGLAISNDGTRLYAMPRLTSDYKSYLYEFNIETGQKKYLANFSSVWGYMVGIAMDSEGSLYFHSHHNGINLIKFYSDCAGTVCSDGTPRNQCSAVMGAPWYCDGSGNLVENCSQCGCSGDWVCPYPPGTSCCSEDSADIIASWDSGIRYWDAATSAWTEMTPSSTTGDIAAGDFTGDGKVDVASIWKDEGLWYQDGLTLEWVKIDDLPPYSVAAGDVTGDGRDEIIGTWYNGIWYWDAATSAWTQMTPFSTTGDIAAGDFSGDGKADVASIWKDEGLWYQDGATLKWTKIDNLPPYKVAAGDVTGDGRDEIIGTWYDGIWYWDAVSLTWTQMTEFTTTGDIAAGDFNGDGKVDVASSWEEDGLWYQDGATLKWTKIDDLTPYRVAAGNIAGK